MCPSTHFHRLDFRNDHLDRLKITSFFIRLSNMHASYKKLPESLTLVYLPRISETGLEVSGKEIRPDSPAFVTLYQAIMAKTGDGEGVYLSRELVTASDGVMFEVYFRDEKILKGIFRRDVEGEWKLECKCSLERESSGGGGDMARAEVCVGSEGHVAMVDRVDMVAKRRSSNRRRRVFGDGLEDIPEEREGDTECGMVSWDGCGCSGVEAETRSEVQDLLDIEMEGVRWAVDVGLWVVCLGVGYLVSKASAKSLLRGKRIS